MAYSIWVMLLFALSLLALALVAIATGTYEPPQTRKLALGAFAAGCCLTRLFYLARHCVRG
jgi:hypothetical protein